MQKAWAIQHPFHQKQVSKTWRPLTVQKKIDFTALAGISMELLKAVTIMQRIGGKTGRSNDTMISITQHILGKLS